MKEYILDLRSIDDLANFCKLLNISILSDVDAYSVLRKAPFDAKSLLSLTNLSSMPIRVEILSDDEEELAKFKLICERYQWKDGE